MKLVFLLLLAITAVLGCPRVQPNDPDREFGHDMSFSPIRAQNSAVVEAEAALKKVIGDEGIKIMKASERCQAPRSQPASSFLSKRYHSYWWYYWVSKCEPCRPYNRYIYSFHHSTCFVIFPHWQRIRTVQCSYRTCRSPCDCGNSKCLPSQYHRVFFWGWCSKNVSNWHQGLNYNYLYLPQDCSCYEQIFYKTRYQNK